MAKTQEDSYWWRDTSLPESQQKMRGLCEKCHYDRGIGVYWPGKTAGYGDYDLYCFFCKRPIYIREEINEDTTTN